MFLPNTNSFQLKRRTIIKPDFASSDVAPVVDAVPQTLKPDVAPVVDDTSQTLKPDVALVVVATPQTLKPTDLKQSKVKDQGKRNFLKVVGVIGAGIAGSLLLPRKADALILGSSPTTGVVGVKNVANTRINPATEETASLLLKTSDLTFDSGDLQVKVTSPGSFSDSGDVTKSGLVDADRHVQVDVLSSVLPTDASTETTLDTISFGGVKFALRLDTVGDIDYIGEATIGTATNIASWRIKRVDSSTGIIIQWAGGTGGFDKIWNNRASLSYS